MAGALSENAPRPVSVVTVDGVTVQPHPQRQNRNETDQNQPLQPHSQQQPQHHQQQHDQQNDENVTGTCVPTDNVQFQLQQPQQQPQREENLQQQLQHHQQQHHQHQQQQQHQQINVQDNRDHQDQATTRPVRSFASTEAQTELAVGGHIFDPASHHHHHHHHNNNSPHVTSQYEQHQLTDDQLRDARRRERRVRRHHRRAMRSCALPPNYAGVVAPGSCVPGTVGPVGGVVTNGPGVGPVPGPPGMPLVPSVGAFLHPPPPHLGLRGLSLGLPFPVPASVSAFGRDAVPKQCCGLGSPPVRWSIVGVGIVGLVCAAAGALLGALRATGRDHIAVSLLMIGIGVVLVAVSAVAWRVTSRENCGSFFGFTGITGRMPPARPMHPYAAMIYPEFQFRTPPPSYQASMQEYRLRLLLLDRLQPASSPPPTYRSNAPSIVAPACATRESRPPSYCGRANVAPTATLGTSKKDANLVRIVQTDTEPVILSGDQTPPIAAVEVLAHL